MRTARWISLLCGVTVLVLVSLPANASAVLPIQPVHEETGDICNPCVLHLIGERTMYTFHVMAIDSCAEEWVVELEADGSAHVIDYEATFHSDTTVCRSIDCPDPESEWPIRFEEVAEDGIVGFVRSCVASSLNPSAAVHCDMPLSISEAVGDHQYTFESSPECSVSGTPVEFHGSWQAEAVHNPVEEDEVELSHPPDVPVTVVDEAGGIPCDPSCTVHMVGESAQTIVHMFTISECQDEITMEITSDGTGIVTSYTNTATHAGSDCGFVNCEGTEGAWPTREVDEIDAATTSLSVQVCLANRGDHSEFIHCNVTRQMREEGDAHHYVVELNRECGDEFPVTYTANWETEVVAGEGEQQVEVVHSQGGR